MCEPAKLLPEICCRLSDPRPAALCNHNTTGYFFMPSYPGGTNRRYCMVSPVELWYVRARNSSAAIAFDCAFATKAPRNTEIAARARPDRASMFPDYLFTQRCTSEKQPVRASLSFNVAPRLSARPPFLRGVRP